MNECLCKDCRFFEGSLEPEDKHGWCVRYPPTVVMNHNFDAEARWPKVHEEDWCGEWRSTKPYETISCS